MLLEMNHVSFFYPGGRPILQDLSFHVESGEIIGIIGPSGYGKSTMAKILAGYLKPKGGEVRLDGKPLPKKGFCPVQMIFQHPEKAIDEKWTMRRALNECWSPDDKFLEKMHIEKEWLSRYPSELSGGEMQRFCIARVLAPQVEFLIADEITTMLDAISQAQIWELLLEVAEERNLGMVVITHNRFLAEKICTRIVDISHLNHLSE